ncbi:MAG TPA: ATP-binding protein [Gemmatimonadales bacterium]|nr:ATP-binding protein [Gemmatimonadales bacterium]
MTATAGTTADAHASVLLAAITLGLALLCVFLYRRYRKPFLLWWVVAWGLYLVRGVVIGTFLVTGQRPLLYAHQVVTGWTALALVWAALVFTRPRRLPAGYLLAAVLLPVVWAYVTIYRLNNFLLAAGPTVLLLSAVTFWTGWIFFRHWRNVRTPGALILAITFSFWSLHHLDYPVLRARGAWSPWGYYLDLLFLLATGAGILVLVEDELRSEHADLTARLARLSAGLLEQYEAERRRLSFELHDETAQVFTAVKLQLGVLRERSSPTLGPALANIDGLIDTGMRSIRRITNQLRPSLLDDLGLLPALRSLGDEFVERSGIRLTLEAPTMLPEVAPRAELAVFRAMQEALANVARHSGAHHVRVSVRPNGDRLSLEVEDDGRGLPAGFQVEGGEREGHLGLAGMRERMSALHGEFAIRAGASSGTLIRVSVPLYSEENS